ncbi:MAG: hypothetical protein HRU20_14630 [Pseudomonadales bacterium]|nr:hypothetical protein [Pseudomonadales bacterium]
MNELIISIRKALFERATSPLAGTYALSWVLFNFELIIIIIGKGDFDKKQMALIDWFATHDNLYTYGVPIGVTIFYIGLFPILTYATNWVTLKYKKWIVDKKFELEGEIPRSAKEVHELEDKIAELNQRNRETNTQVAEIEKQSQQIQTEADKLVNDAEEKYKFGLHQENEKHKKELTDLANKYKVDMGTEIKESLDKIVVLDTENRQLKGTIFSYETKSEDWEDSKQKYKEQISNLETKTKTLQRLNKQGRAELLALKPHPTKVSTKLRNSASRTTLKKMADEDLGLPVLTAFEDD